MENSHGKISLDKINPLSQSSTNTHFYLQQKKSESYATIIQMLKSDLIQIQDIINSNSGDIKMYKILNKSPGLSKKLTEIESTMEINNYINKINEDSKNIKKISKIYNCKEDELIQKLYKELCYNELLLKKINDFFILMKLKIYRDDTYQETLSKIITINSFIERALTIPVSNIDINSVKMKLKEEKNNSNENKNLAEKNEEKKESLNNNNNDNKTFFTEMKLDNNDTKNNFKKILEEFEKIIKKEKFEFNQKINGEIKELNNEINKLREENDILIEEKNNLEKNLEDIRGKKIDQDSYENILRDQFNDMKEAFKEKINELNDELENIKQETRVKFYQKDEELKQANYLKNAFLEEISSLQDKLENKN